jgi:pimeloyl-ACP methyl ester carboxylesterase
MPTLLLLLATAQAVSPAPATVQVRFVKVAPHPDTPERTTGQARAVVLLHGLSFHPFREEKAVKPHFHFWQQPDSALVKRLARDADVYAVAYGQNVPVEQLASDPTLPRHLRELRKAGYRQIVLVGHSAGGLIARHLVEDHPELGVTRVIQVCAPNAGSSWASLKTARAAQKPFLTSITRAARQKLLEGRAGKRIPDDVAFACVVGSCNLKGDGLVFSKSQWPADLQAQGVPAFPLWSVHWDAMSSGRAVELLSRLVVEPLPRWDAKQVEEARKKLLGE